MKLETNYMNLDFIKMIKAPSKKLLFILALSLLWCNLGFSKIINIENKITLDMPNNHKYIKLEEDQSLGDVDLSEMFEAFDILEPDIFMTGPSNLIDFYQSLINGEDPMNNEVVSLLFKKLEKKASSFKNEITLNKMIVKEIKKTLKKEKIDFENYIIISKKKISELDLSDLGFDLSEIKGMNNEELANLTKELRNEATKEAGDNKTISSGPATIVIKKLKVSKNKYNELFLNAEINLSIAINDYMSMSNLNYIFFVIEKNDYSYLIISECLVNCSNHAKKFKKMIKPAFSQKLAIKKNVSSQEISSNIVEQLKQLKQLYEEGALTKEEFEIAKKKLLN